MSPFEGRHRRHRDTMNRKYLTKADIGMMMSKKNNNKNKNNKNNNIRRYQPLSFPKIGQFIGNSIMGKTGGLVGRNIGLFMNKITGSGDYKINGNTILQGQVPVFANSGRETTIFHKEFIADISGTTNFTLASYPINPGMAVTFPWLSQVAANYEQYEMLGLTFDYVPTSGNAVGSTNTALGSVIMATDYDPDHPPFVSKQQMASYEFSCTSVPYTGMIHGVECKSKSRPINVLYNRSSVLAPNEDYSFYDLGNFQIATQGMQNGTTVIGELWVSYHIKLMKPRTSIPLNILSQYAHVTEGLANTAVAGSLLGTTGGVLSAQSNLYGIGAIGTNTIVLSAVGTYILSANWISTGSIASVPTIALGNNMATYAVLHGANTQSAFTTVRSTIIAAFVVNAVGNGAENTLTFGGVSSLPAGSQCDVIICLAPSGININNF